MKMRIEWVEHVAISAGGISAAFARSGVVIGDWDRQTKMIPLRITCTGRGGNTFTKKIVHLCLKMEMRFINYIRRHRYNVGRTETRILLLSI